MNSSHSAYPNLQSRELPKPPSWKQAVGVGVVVMGMAMGTGELIMWPHLIVKHGLNVLWLAFVGITCQYVINQEVARHTLATGEGFFTSSARVWKWTAPFWLVSALLLYIWPGWASAIGTIARSLFEVGSYQLWAWIALALVLILAFSGKTAYGILERSMKITVPAFFLLLVFISFFNLSPSLIKQAFAGMTAFGVIPVGIDMNVLLGAVVFAGAGGMLNLCVSLWYRDKQLGMNAYVGRIENPITGKHEAVSATGFTFDPTSENLERWRGWMRYMRIDQGVIFWFLGLVTLVLLGLNAYAALRPIGVVPEGLQVAVTQSAIFSQRWGVIGEKLYLVMALLMLFSVMWSVIDALARMVSDIVFTNTRVGPFKDRFLRFQTVSMHTLYYISIVSVVIVGALLLPFKQPLAWLTISAVLGGLTMAIYTPLLFYMNTTRLAKPLRPGMLTNAALLAITAFFLVFFLSSDYSSVRLKFLVFTCARNMRESRLIWTLTNNILLPDGNGAFRSLFELSTMRLCNHSIAVVHDRGLVSTDC